MKRNIVWGVVLILVGVLYLLSVTGVIVFNGMYLLPVALLAVVAYMQVQYFRENRIDTGKPIASGLLLALAVIFFFCAKDGMEVFKKLYPLILLGMSLGIVEEIITRQGKSGSWVVAAVLAALGLVLLFSIRWADVWKYGVPVALIIAGISVLWRPRRS